MQLFGLGQKPVFLCKFLLFIRRESRLLKLLELKLVEFVELLFLFHLVCQLLQLIIHLNQAAVSMCQDLPIRQQARVGIQEIDVRTDPQKGLVLVLPMKIHQRTGECFQVTEPGGLFVYENARGSAGTNHPADYPRVIATDQFAFYNRRILTSADDITSRTATRQKADGINKD
ncbi:hypothetical protein ES703_79871 [subsurface metagenome]